MKKKMNESLYIAVLAIKRLSEIAKTKTSDNEKFKHLYQGADEMYNKFYNEQSTLYEQATEKHEKEIRKVVLMLDKEIQTSEDAEHIEMCRKLKEWFALWADIREVVKVGESLDTALSMFDIDPGAYPQDDQKDFAKVGGLTYSNFK